MKNSEINKNKVQSIKYIPLMTTLLMIQALLILLKTNWLIATIAFSFSLLSFTFLSHNGTDREKAIAYTGFKISIIIFIYGFILGVGSSVDLTPGSSIKVRPLMFLLATTVSIAVVSAYINREKRNKIDENLLKMQGWKPLNNNKNKAVQKGSVELCIDVDTKEKVILPFEDRFLHMLILGPTGSGKTSQIILPMINQDMKNLEYGVTVIEPKGDLAEKVYAMAKYYGREAVYFNPTHPDCPYFNPLYGDESEVIENMATTFKMLSASEKSNPFFDNMNENLIRNALKLLKRLKGNNATLIDLSTIVYNSQGQGKMMVNQFARVRTNTVEEAKENGDIASWFLSEYYNERSKTYEHCSGLRSQVSKITSNVHLRRVLNPPDGRNDVDFGEFIEAGKILAISTAQGDLRDLGRFLGYFIILNFQSAVFKRPGTENTRRPHFLYIDEFQTYSNPGFADMLTQGRSYRVASHLATQNRALMAMGGGKDGNNFVELVSTNARNIVFFPGGNSKDAKYYSDEFGDVLKKKREKSINRPKINIFTGGLKKVGPPSENIRESEGMDKRFSASDLIYRNFGEISYRIVKNKTVQAPGIGTVSWLPKEFNKILDEMVEDYRDGYDVNDEVEIEEFEEKESSNEPTVEQVDVFITFDEDEEFTIDNSIEAESKEKTSTDTIGKSVDAEENNNRIKEELKENPRNNEVKKEDKTAIIDIMSNDFDDLI